MNKIIYIFVANIGINLRRKVMDLFNLLIGLILGVVFGIFIKRIIIIFQIILRNYGLICICNYFHYFCKKIKNKVMDIFNLIIGIIIGILASLFVKRFSYFIKVFLCFATTFLFIKIIHPEIIIKSIYEWTWYNLFNGYNFWGLAILGFIVSWCVFYWMIPKAINSLVIKKLERKFDSAYKNASLYEVKNLKRIFYCVVKKTVNVLSIISWSHQKRVKYNEKENLSYEDYVNATKIVFAISIHLIISYFTFFPFNEYFILPIILIIITILYFIFCYPIIKNFIYFIQISATHEHNRNIK